MATIGTLGDIPFHVSKNAVKTIEGLKWDTSSKFEVHDRHLKDDLLEFVGTEPGTMSFSVYISVFLGVNPMQEIVKLLNAERKGLTMPLVIGEKAYGRYRWVITKTSKSLERFDNKGNLLVAKVDISLTEYVQR